MQATLKTLAAASEAALAASVDFTIPVAVSIGGKPASSWGSVRSSAVDEVARRPRTRGMGMSLAIGEQLLSSCRLCAHPP